jgi:Uma2 family endonuclease
MEPAMTAPPTAPPFTYDDLRSFPDDHYRRELVDGQLIVSPSPRKPHQRMVTRLLVVLQQAAPPALEVLAGPIDVVFSQSTVLVPDIVVIRADDEDVDYLSRPPLLVVEVASPSTRRTDRTLKLATYAAGRVPSYWLTDPEGPSLTVMELTGDHYGDPVTVTGDQALRVERPFPVELTPARLTHPTR